MIGLNEDVHLCLAKRGVLPTPVHNLALMSSQTTGEHVHRQIEIMCSAVVELPPS